MLRSGVWLVITVVTSWRHSASGCGGMADCCACTRTAPCRQQPKAVAREVKGRGIGASRVRVRWVMRSGEWHLCLGSGSSAACWEHGMLDHAPSAAWLHSSSHHASSVRVPSSGEQAPMQRPLPRLQTQPPNQQPTPTLGCAAALVVPPCKQGMHVIRRRGSTHKLPQDRLQAGRQTACLQVTPAQKRCTVPLHKHR